MNVLLMTPEKMNRNLKRNKSDFMLYTWKIISQQIFLLTLCALKITNYAKLPYWCVYYCLCIGLPIQKAWDLHRHCLWLKINIENNQNSNKYLGEHFSNITKTMPLKFKQNFLWINAIEIIRTNDIYSSVLHV